MIIKYTNYFQFAENVKATSFKMQKRNAAWDQIIIDFKQYI